MTTGRMKAIAATALAALCMAGGAKAALINKGDYTLDTMTGLDWYNPGLTRGLSFTAASSGQGSASLPISLGFRLANLSEFDALMTSYVGPANLLLTQGFFYRGASNDYYTGALSTILTLGPVLGFNDVRAPYNINFPSGTLIAAQGWIAGPGNRPGMAIVSAVTYLQNQYPTENGYLQLAEFYGGWGGLDDFPATPGQMIGSFFVRPAPSPVPTPGTLALLGAGLFGWFGIKRSRRAGAVIGA